jgi:hypothetical protein
MRMEGMIMVRRRRRTLMAWMIVWIRWKLMIRVINLAIHLLIWPNRQKEMK